MISTFFEIILGMLATIFGCVFLALESIQLAIAAVFCFPASKKLVVVLFWNQINFVQLIGIWFQKPPKQPGKSKGRMITFEQGARGFTKVSACAGGRVIENTDTRKQGRLRTNTPLVVLLIWNLGLSILQLHFQYCCMLMRESSWFFCLTMDSSRENDSKSTNILGTESELVGHDVGSIVSQVERSTFVGHDFGPIISQVDKSKLVGHNVGPISSQVDESTFVGHNIGPSVGQVDKSKLDMTCLVSQSLDRESK